MKKYQKALKFLMILLFCFFATGCSKQETKVMENINLEMKMYQLEDVKQYCIDDTGTYLYAIKDKSSSIYRYSIDGTYIDEIVLDADENEKLFSLQIGEYEDYTYDLSAITVDQEWVYCVRSAKCSILAVHMNTREQKLIYCEENLTDVTDLYVTDHFIFICSISSNGQQELSYMNKETCEMSSIPMKGALHITECTDDTIWIFAMNQNENYYIQKYDAKSASFEEAISLNLVHDISEMIYDKATGFLYAYQLSEEQFLRIDPENAELVARFNKAKIDTNTGKFYMYMYEDTLYIWNEYTKQILYFEPELYIENNIELTGFVMNSCEVDDWQGYQIDLEVMEWDQYSGSVVKTKI